jgi:signal transduction histidine kinase
MIEREKLANNQLEPEDYERLLRRYDQLHELFSSLAATLDLDVLLHRIVEAARVLTECEAVSLLLYDPQSQNLYFEAATDLLIEGLGRKAVPTDNSIAGWIFTHSEPLLVEDALKDPRFFREVDVITRFQTSNILGVPLRTKEKEKTLGVIEAVNKLEGKFDGEDLRLLQTLAAQAAIAIENTTLFQQNDLVAEMVHELRTPLTALTAVANLLQRPDLPQEQRMQLASTLNKEVKRLNGMTTDFLELAKLETGRSRFFREPVHLGGLIEECIEILRLQAEEEQISMEVSLDRAISPVFGDRNRLKQVFLNLLTNAIKYNTKGGKVNVRLSRGDEQVVVEIQDTGHGIPPESLPFIFDRFYRVPEQETATPGTGLGLAIAKRIIESHDGTISAKSTLNKGSTFNIQLPIEAAQMERGSIRT